MNRTKPENTKAQQRRDAIKSAVLSSLLQIAAAAVLLWVRSAVPIVWLSRVLLILAALDLLSLIPTFVVLKQRFKEIEGGEIDAARKY